MVNKLMPYVKWLPRVIGENDANLTDTEGYRAAEPELARALW